ncbi:hypothetical protein GCM10011507_07820 [Edaphobacter acidisoli]|uniref:YncE family protein n=1 Tax=Edaphobacter acidisoli TaxID=2040573 RepID=A0A916W1E0_9BACT|nr:YncE family protein [Edaphobacter acidisoli]GGA58884.1 hypothetical protein GCM10011507_07820 [Edaphobacter acidisoli]
MPHLRQLVAATTLALLATVTGCSRYGFPTLPKGYQEYAYVTNGGSNTVTVLDLVYLRQDRTLQVGQDPSGIAANPRRNEVYAVNTQPDSSSGSVSVINAATNQVVAAISVHRLPYFIAVSPNGRRAYVPNAGSNSVSVLDLDRRREVATVSTGDQPGVARVSPDGRTLVVTNRGSNSVSLYDIAQPYSPSDTPELKLRATFSGCSGATDAVILPDSSKVFVACSGGHKIMAVQLAAAPGSWPARQDPTQLTDHLLTLLDVGKTPVHLALKPDGGEIFVSNFGSDSISEVDTWNNQVIGTYSVVNKPTGGIVAGNNSDLWVSNFSSDSLSLYSIDDGHVVNTVHTGSAPDSLAFSENQYLLLAADAHSGDVAVIRTQGKNGPGLFTILPSGRSPNAIAVKAIQHVQ